MKKKLKKQKDIKNQAPEDSVKKTDLPETETETKKEKEEPGETVKETADDPDPKDSEKTEAGEEEKEETQEAKPEEEKEETQEAKPEEEKEETQEAKPDEVKQQENPQPEEDKEEDEEEDSEKKSKKKKIKIAMGIVAVLSLLLIYVGMGKYFTNHFYGNTWINEIDCSYLTSGQVKQLIQGKINDYQLDFVTLEKESYPISAEEMGLTYIDDKQVDEILRKQKPMEWILHVFAGGTHQVPAAFQYDEAYLNTLVENLPFAQEDFYTEPEDAYMEFREGGFQVIPEVEGNKPNMMKLQELAKEAVDNGITTLSLAENNCYITPVTRQDDPELTATVTNLNQVTAASLTFPVGDEPVVLDGNTLKDWVVTDENGNNIIDPNKIDEFVNNLADQVDTYGGTREFTKNNGEVITLSKNYYGWEVDRKESIQQIKQAISEGRQGEMDLVYTRTAMGRGSNDLGSVYVEISIDEQRMWCYKDGQVVVDTPIVSGNLSIPGRATPRNGCWTIYRKRTEYTMRGERRADGTPEYTAFCHFWLPFNGGVGIHDLASRTKFGGDIYKTRGSHGCINTPLDKVEIIFNTVSVGTPVIVY